MSKSKLLSAALVFCLAALTPYLQAAVGGGGLEPIPSFVIYETAYPTGPVVHGGTGSTLSPLSLTFDPATTYLPVSPNAAQTYLYQLIWDFGDNLPVPTQLRERTSNVATLTLASATSFAVGQTITVSGLANSSYNGTFTITAVTATTISYVNSGANEATVSDPAGVVTPMALTTAVPAAPTANAALALAPVTHTYFGDQQFTVKLSVLVFVLSPDGSLSSGPSIFTTRVVRLANTNYPPVAEISDVGSPAVGTLPYTASVTVSNSYDPDGYVIWAALDWGDGSSQLVSPLPLNVPSQTLTHTYTAAGIYKITLSVIDNGRLPLSSPLLGVPASNDPSAALLAIRQFQASLPLTSLPAVFGDPAVNPQAAQNLLDTKFQPALVQNFLWIQVPGNLSVVKGFFVVDFAKPSSDIVDLTLKLNVDLESLSGVTVSARIGTFNVPSFVTNARGAFKGSGLRFNVTPKKQLVRLRINQANLATGLGITNQTRVNGNIDLPFTLTLNGIPLTTTVRFVFNAEAGKKGLGTDARSYPAGN